MANENHYTSSNGSTIAAVRDSNRDEPDFIVWSVAPTYGNGTMPNSKKSRAWLRRVLKQFERDAVRLEKRQKRQRSFKFRKAS